MTVIPVDLSAIVDGQQVDALDVIVPLNDLKTAAEQILDGGYDFLLTRWVDASIVIIDTDSLVVSQTRHLVETEDSLPTDNLSTITAINIDFLLLQLNSPGQTIIIKHNVGNIWFESGRDYILDDENYVLAFVWSPDTGLWTSSEENPGNIYLTDSFSETIASGVITAAQTKIKILPQSGTADDLDTITITNGVDILVLNTETVGHTITVKHNTGNIWFEDGQDVVLDNQNKTLVLVWNDVVSKWTNAVAAAAAGMTYSDPLLNSGSFTDLEVTPNTYTPGPPLFLDVMPRWVNRRMFWDQVVTGTTFDTVAMTMTNVGTPTGLAAGWGRFVQLLSAAVVNSAASRRSNALFQWRWSPTVEIRTGQFDVNGVTNWFGLIAATLPAVAAGPTITYVGVTGVWISAQNATTANMRVYEAGVLLGQTSWTTSGLGASGRATTFRIWIDGINNNIVGEANGVRSSVLNVVPTSLATTNLLLSAVNKTAIAGACQLYIGDMYVEQT